MGPSTYARIAEITSGRTIFQQGLATTCKDLLISVSFIQQEGFGLSHESIGAMKEG